MAVIDVDQLGDFLESVGYHAALIRPLLPMYLHLILSALFPIFTGAHASLSRPSSASKPSKKTKTRTETRTEEDGEDDAEGQQKMEGLSPMDALLFPVMGGLTLAGLYYVIKYLEDPAILNKILNWYFAIFGTLSLARLLTDMVSVVWSVIFPNSYQQSGEIWKIDQPARKVSTKTTAQPVRQTPLPGYLALLPVPSTIIQYLWTIRGIPNYKLRIHAYIHKHLTANLKVGFFGLASLAVAVVIELYFNLIDKPWWLTNLLGFSFAYAALQIMSPTTAWTGTLILGGLFFYDIYFVFFTPMMVTVATKIDIPAKLLFPRPEAEGMSMLGLGDVVLPGMMIGFALRFDLYLFYLRKQTKAKKAVAQRRTTRSSKELGDPAKPAESNVAKAEWVPATGGWGERFWTWGATQSTTTEQGGKFPKTYFYATITGYVTGLLATLGVMQVFGHAQPALLYLVPGVLGALWGTALRRGELKILWGFSEDEDESNDEEGKQKRETPEKTATSDWTDWFIIGRVSKKMEEKEKAIRETAEKSEVIGKFVDDGTAEMRGDRAEAGKDSRDADKGKAKLPKWDGRLVSFSISLPQPSYEM